MDTNSSVQEKSALDRVIEIFETQDALASALGIRSPSITGWKLRGRVPAERCVDIERITSGEITRYQLRPDVFGPAPGQEAA